MASSTIKRRTEEKPVNGFLTISTISKAVAAGSTWEDKVSHSEYRVEFIAMDYFFHVNIV